MSYPKALQPGYYWCKNGNWEIIFIRSDGLVDARGAVQSLDMSDVFRNCDLSGPILPPDDIERHQSWARKEGRREA